LIRLNWVLILCGLIPFWTALLVIVINRGAAKPRRTFRETPNYETDYETGYVSEYDYDERPQPRPSLGFLKRINLGFLSKLRSRLPGRKKPEARQPQAAPQGEAEDMYDDMKELQPQAGAAAGFMGPELAEERRLWGKTLLIFTGAGFVNGLNIALNYMFTTYRKSIGMKMPLASELKLASNLTMAVLGLSVLYAALKTGLRLAKS
jgi:hypothetical protein